MPDDSESSLLADSSETDAREEPPSDDGSPASVGGALAGRPVGRPLVTPYGVGALLAGALLPTAFSSQTLSSSFTPKYFVLLLVAAFGVVPLVKLARSSHVSVGARGAVVFLAIGLLAVLLSPAINIGLLGLYQWGTGWLFWLGCAGAFAIGARMSVGDLDWACAGIALGAVGNAFAAVYQIVAAPGGALALYDNSQADGLLGNPIHLEAVLLGALALIAGRASLPKTRMTWWPAVVLLGVALEFTLERVGVILMIVLVVAALGAYGVKRAWPFALLTLGGWGIGYLAGGSGLGKRVASGTAETTFGTRFRIWDLALHSTLHHPFIGIGPGELLSAVAPRMTETFARDLGPGRLPVDSHDFLIEVLATTGVLGLLAFATWLGGAALKARGPFLGCAIMILSVELIEPLNLGTTPVALLALGAATVVVAGEPVGLAAILHWRSTLRDRAAAARARAGGPALPDAAGESSLAPASEPAPAGTSTGSTLAAAGDRFEPTAERRRRLSPISLVVTLLLVIGALTLGGTMIVGDHYLLDEYTDFPPGPKVTAGLDANRLLFYWPESASAVAGAYQWRQEILHLPGSLKMAQPYVQSAVNRDPADPLLRADAGDLQLLLGDRAGAQRLYLQALQRDPWTAQALIGLGTIARDEHEWAASARWLEKAQLVSPPSPTLAQEIRSDLSHLSNPA